MTSGDQVAALRSRPALVIEPLPLLAAGVLALGLVATAGREPLPTCLWAAAFLFLAAESDLRTRRIPNAISFPALGGAIALAGLLGGVGGVQTALLGAGVAFGLLLLPFAFRVLGAGDVKALMVLGALFGAQAVLAQIVWLVLIAGACAVAVVAWRGELTDLASRWLHTGLALRTTGKLTYFAPRAGTAAASHMPMGLVIGLSVIAFQVWGTPWSF